MAKCVDYLVDYEGKSICSATKRNKLSPQLAVVRSTVVGDAASLCGASRRTWKAGVVSVPV